jgi:CcmD family protein
MLRRLLLAIAPFALTAASAFAQPEQLNEYKPVTGPPPETIPAAPLVIAAYIIVWLGLMVYLWSIWRRLGRVEAELQALQRRTPGSVH